VEGAAALVILALIAIAIVPLLIGNFVWLVAVLQKRGSMRSLWIGTAILAAIETAGTLRLTFAGHREPLFLVLLAFPLGKLALTRFARRRS
jgi:hypothetical protein